MTTRGRVICGVLGGLLGIWAVSLFLVSPVLTFRGDDAEIACESVANAGWPDPLLSEGGNSRSYTFDVTAGELPESERGQDTWAVQDRVESKCDRRRTTYAAGMTLILCPATLLAAGALFGPRLAFPRTRPAGGGRVDGPVGA